MIPGEKLHEILITEEELPRTRDLPGYFIVEPWWSGNRFTEEYMSSQNLVGASQDISSLLARSDKEFAKYGLKDSVFLK